MSAPNDLTTLENALTWLGVASDDNGIVARLITSVSTSIQKWLGYSVALSTYTRTFNGSGGKVIMLPDRPVISVSSVIVDTLPIPAQIFPAYGYSFSSNSLYLSGCYGFCRGFQNISVVYTAGYVSTPCDLEQACLDWVKICLSRQSIDANITQLRSGDSQITQEVSVSGVPPSAISLVLQPYRRMS